MCRWSNSLAARQAATMGCIGGSGAARARDIHECRSKPMVSSMAATVNRSEVISRHRGECVQGRPSPDDVRRVHENRSGNRLRRHGLRSVPSFVR